MAPPKVSYDASKRRWDPSISPTSTKWANQLSAFRLYLSPNASQTLEQILTTHFTPHDRQLVLPATHPPWLVESQAHNTERYRRLLAGPRFKGVEDSTAVRLTMLFFGLPCEPIMSGMFRSVDPDVEMLDGAGVRTYEVRPPLHFLTAYENRHYGRDELRGV